MNLSRIWFHNNDKVIIQQTGSFMLNRNVSKCYSTNQSKQLTLPSFPRINFRIFTRKAH